MAQASTAFALIRKNEGNECNSLMIDRTPICSEYGQVPVNVGDIYMIVVNVGSPSRWATQRAGLLVRIVADNGDTVTVRFLTPSRFTPRNGRTTTMYKHSLAEL